MTAGIDLTKPTAGPMTLANPYCVHARIDSAFLARQGALVASRGELTIEVKGQGARKLIKRALTGEGLALMQLSGTGEAWLADRAKNVFLVAVGGDPDSAVTVNGRNVLCFDPSVSYEIGRVKGAGMAAGGLFNCAFSGRGTLAITSHGEPLAIPVSPSAPVRVDTDAVLCWTSGLATSIHKSESLKSVLKGGSGEAFQLELAGEGMVVVQPGEGPLEPKKDGLAGALGEFIG